VALYPRNTNKNNNPKVWASKNQATSSRRRCGLEFCLRSSRKACLAFFCLFVVHDVIFRTTTTSSSCGNCIDVRFDKAASPAMNPINQLRHNLVFDVVTARLIHCAQLVSAVQKGLVTNEATSVTTTTVQNVAIGIQIDVAALVQKQGQSAH
jgi:hypothetical protein